MAVLDDSSATIAPRRDVVAFHQFIIELAAAKRTDMRLLFPYCQFDVFGEGTKVEITLVACQDVWDDARLPLYVAVAHQC